MLLIGGRRLFGRSVRSRSAATQDPSYLSRLSVAFWSTLLPSAALGVFLGATYFFFDYFSVLRGDIGAMLAALFGVIGLVFFVHRLGSAVLSPRLPDWRLIPVRSRRRAHAAVDHVGDRAGQRRSTSSSAPSTSSSTRRCR